MANWLNTLTPEGFCVSQKIMSLQCEIAVQVAKKNLMLQLLQGFL